MRLVARALMLSAAAAAFFVPSVTAVSAAPVVHNTTQGIPIPTGGEWPPSIAQNQLVLSA